MAKKKRTSGKGEAEDVFVIVQRAFDARRQREKEARWAAMSEAERHESRASVMAVGSFWRCLGPPAEEYAGDDYMARVQEALLECIENGKEDDGPRPLLFANGGMEVCDERLVKKKYFNSTTRMRLPIVFHRDEGEVSLVCHVEQPNRNVYGPKTATHFSVCLGVGLFSDMVFSASVGEYVYLHPEWEGKYFSCVSSKLSLNHRAAFDLRVELPFRGGLPDGLHLVGSVSIDFYRDVNGELHLCGGGGMDVKWIDR